MNRTNAPVNFTCPDIDKLITELAGAVKLLKSVCKDYELPKDAISDIERAIDDVEDTYYTGYRKTSLIEQLRQSNDELRGWGEGLYKELNESSNLQ